MLYLSSYTILYHFKLRGYIQINKKSIGIHLKPCRYPYHAGYFSERGVIIALLDRGSVRKIGLDMFSSRPGGDYSALQHML